MNKIAATRMAYQNAIKPLLFKVDAEKVHDRITEIGEFCAKSELSNNFTRNLLSYSNRRLYQKIQGVEFENPMGLSAGFDYDGHLAKTMCCVGFGFNTIGTVTAQKYEGNERPRLDRLIESKSLLVNKGFKSEGADKVLKRLNNKNLKESTIGISVGSTNIPEINTIPKAIDDYLYTFDTFRKKKYVKYFELNISCPNTTMKEPFTNIENYEMLIRAVYNLHLGKPLFVKMPNEIAFDDSDKLVEMSLKYGINGFIFSNLVKKRTNKALAKKEIKNIENLKGNFSGKPTQENANSLIEHNYKKYGKEIVIIGAGGVFTAEDAYEKIRLGSSLVQLITGLVFEGPQLIGEINRGLVELIKNDGFESISEAIGSKYNK